MRRRLPRDPENAACHYNLGSSFQALDRQDEAAIHFSKAIELGVRLKNAEDLILQNPAIVSCVDAIESKWPLPIAAGELFARYSLETIADDIFLRCALATVPLHHAPLEKFLTVLRAILLRAAATDHGIGDTATSRLFCALAQQCFINEYVFAQGDEETRQSLQLRELLLRKIADGEAITALWWPPSRPISRSIRFRARRRLHEKSAGGDSGACPPASAGTVGGDCRSKINSGSDQH